jgi:ABC-type branched-subunit amino acid transport system ATPase component
MPTSSVSEGNRPSPHLVLEHLDAGYGAAPVVSGIDMVVGTGEVVAIIGPNGAGKSTLLKAIMCRIPTSAGRVVLGGRDITNVRAEMLARMGVGYVPQTRDVFDTLTVQENLEMGGYLVSNAAIKVRIDEVLETFPALAKMRDRTASKLSGGERKMLAIARVLMLQPTLLILDEPTSNLSAELSRMVLSEHVRRLADDGATVLLVEQKAFEALAISDWAYVLVAGSTLISGPSADLLARADIRDVFLGQGTGHRDGTGVPAGEPLT